eukprot:TRINITY_DN942_c0_g3_i1.p1 TRINITY_DN942_c0_g3~~TRINITY_DN942_c0_g3_i1.p1  ORF type:complete len:1501 (+),score=412.81 TRINITY_DN942_c0_g3_i1:34-4536(+)
MPAGDEDVELVRTLRQCQQDTAGALNQLLQLIPKSPAADAPRWHADESRSVSPRRFRRPAPEPPPSLVWPGQVPARLSEPTPPDRWTTDYRWAAPRTSPPPPERAQHAGAERWMRRGALHTPSSRSAPRSATAALSPAADVRATPLAPPAVGARATPLAPPAVAAAETRRPVREAPPQQRRGRLRPAELPAPYSVQPQPLAAEDLSALNAEVAASLSVPQARIRASPIVRRRRREARRPERRRRAESASPPRTAPRRKTPLREVHSDGEEASNASIAALITALESTTSAIEKANASATGRSMNTAPGKRSSGAGSILRAESRRSGHGEARRVPETELQLQAYSSLALDTDGTDEELARAVATPVSIVPERRAASVSPGRQQAALELAASGWWHPQRQLSGGSLAKQQKSAAWRPALFHPHIGDDGRRDARGRADADASHTTDGRRKRKKRPARGRDDTVGSADIRQGRGGSAPPPRHRGRSPSMQCCHFGSAGSDGERYFDPPLPAPSAAFTPFAAPPTQLPRRSSEPPRAAVPALRSTPTMTPPAPLHTSTPAPPHASPAEPAQQPHPDSRRQSGMSTRTQQSAPPPPPPSRPPPPPLQLQLPTPPPTPPGSPTPAWATTPPAAASRPAPAAAPPAPPTQPAPPVHPTAAPPAPPSQPAPPVHPTASRSAVRRMTAPSPVVAQPALTAQRSMSASNLRRPSLMGGVKSPATPLQLAPLPSPEVIATIPSTTDDSHPALSDSLAKYVFPRAGAAPAAAPVSAQRLDDSGGAQRPRRASVERVSPRRRSSTVSQRQQQGAPSPRRRSSSVSHVLRRESAAGADAPGSPTRLGVDLAALPPHSATVKQAGGASFYTAGAAQVGAGRPSDAKRPSDAGADPAGRGRGGSVSSAASGAGACGSAPSFFVPAAGNVPVRSPVDTTPRPSGASFFHSPRGEETRSFFVGGAGTEGGKSFFVAEEEEQSSRIPMVKSVVRHDSRGAVSQRAPSAAPSFFVAGGGDDDDDGDGDGDDGVPVLALPSYSALPRVLSVGEGSASPSRRNSLPSPGTTPSFAFGDRRRSFSGSCGQSFARRSSVKMPAHSQRRQDSADGRASSVAAVVSLCRTGDSVCCIADCGLVLSDELLLERVVRGSISETGGGERCLGLRLVSVCGRAVATAAHADSAVASAPVGGEMILGFACAAVLLTGTVGGGLDGVYQYSPADAGSDRCALLCRGCEATIRCAGFGDVWRLCPPSSLGQSVQEHNRLLGRWPQADARQANAAALTEETYTVNFEDAVDGISLDTALRITAVAPGSDADRAGMSAAVGALLCRVGGRPVDTRHATSVWNGVRGNTTLAVIRLPAAIGRQAGCLHPHSLRQAGSGFERTRQTSTAPSAPDGLSRFLVRKATRGGIEALIEDRVVMGVPSGGAAERAGLREGMVIVGVDGRDVRSDEELERAVADAPQTFAVTVAAQGRLTPPESPVEPSGDCSGAQLPPNVTLPQGARAPDLPVSSEGGKCCVVQ